MKCHEDTPDQVLGNKDPQRAMKGKSGNERFQDS